MAPNTEYKGERLSFFQIFSKKKYKLVIPLIQRDYAQGRKNNATNEIRSEFLDALYAYLDENRPNRDLDFVYGTLQKDEISTQTRFIPLDGQQRLTTLFLLHWFLSQISNNKEAKVTFKSKMTCGNKSLFSYETRQSSTEFCDALMQASVDMANLLKDGNGKLSLSDTIKNEPWFFRIWKFDPTIQSMLVMLDAIYEKFHDRPEFFERLLDEQNPIITFIFMDLAEFKLSDDLYIKMNSRGKPLTKFENFKAKFEQYIKTIDTSTDRRFSLTLAGKESAVTLQQYFSFNIDTKWTNLFWQYCKGGKEEKLDSYIENLFRIVVTNYYASVVNLPNKVKTDEAFDVLIGDSESLSYADYDAVKVLTSDAVFAVIDTFDALDNGNEKIARYVSDSYEFYFNEDEVFNNAINNKLTLSERVQFFAYVLYLIHHKDKLDGINDWMRVVCNLSHPENSAIDGNDDFARAVKSIVKLIPHAHNIISYLQGETKIEGFSKHQSKEECVKAHLVVKEGWRSLIEDAEKHPYFNGQIGFLLEFAGILGYYDANKNLTWSDSENEGFQGAFKRYSKIAQHVFELKDGKRVNDKDYCFERAVLAHGDYLLQKNKSPHWNLLSTETNKRDFSWKRLLRMDEDNNKGEIVKKTFDKIEDLDDITGALEKLCVAKTGEKWRDVLISSPSMIKECKSGFLYFGDEIRLITKNQLNSWNAELFTYNLWVDKESVFKNFSSGGLKFDYYVWSTGYYPPRILGVFTYRRRDYDFKISSKLDASFGFQCFQLTFGFRKGKRTDYPQEILDILNNLGYKQAEDGKQVEDGNWFSKSCKTESSALSATKQLSEALAQLNNA